jgi:anti-anti-sigma factor
MSVLDDDGRAPAALDPPRVHPTTIRPDGADEPIAVVAVRGEVDADEAAQLRRAGAALLGTNGAVAVDLSGVTFFGSRGIAALVELHRIADGSGARLSIVTGRANRAVLRPLALTGVDRVLRLVPSVEEIPL